METAGLLGPCPCVLLFLYPVFCFPAWVWALIPQHGPVFCTEGALRLWGLGPASGWACCEN